jgi:hypothetical protein
MKIRVRKLENISDVSVPVQIDSFTTVYLGKGEILENQDVYNLSSIRSMVKVEQDLSEVPVVNEGRKQLYD